MNRPRDEVFAFLDDPENLPKILSNLKDQGVINETPDQVGTTFWHVYEEKGREMKMTGVVTEHCVPERMAVQLDGAVFSLWVAYDFEEIDANSTHLIQYSEAKFKHVFKIFGLIGRKKMEEEGRKSLEESFARMKDMIENGPETTSDASAE
ncbi:MAG: SRPBCC family protein [Planctomycetota bacterium]